MMHNCGSIYELIPDIIASGIDILNPIQISAKNMEPAKLKREFGQDICFWGGGVDTQRILPFGSEEEVRRQVRQNAETFAPGGGYVFNPVHCVQAGVPARNIVAAFDEINGFKMA
jgi:uroporphyrinogen decarboxylase